MTETTDRTGWPVRPGMRVRIDKPGLTGRYYGTVVRIFAKPWRQQAGRVLIEYRDEATGGCHFAQPREVRVAPLRAKRLRIKA